MKLNMVSLLLKHKTLRMKDNSLSVVKIIKIIGMDFSYIVTYFLKIILA